MSLQALLGVVRHLVVERIGVDVNYEVVRHLFGLLRGGDAVYRRRRPRAARRIAEEPVLAPYDEDSLGLLGDVVRELQVPRLRARS